MRIFLRIFYLMVLPLLLMTCDDDETLPYPQAATLDVSEITLDGATFNGTVAQVPGWIVEDHGFVWGDVDELTITGSSRISRGLANSASTFSARVTSDLNPGQRYYVRAYIIGAKGDERHLVYGESASFVSLGSAPPVVTGFEPTHTDVWDTLRIHGKNFSWINERNKVKIGSTFVWVVRSSDTLLKVLVPDSLKTATGYVSVAIAGSVSTSAEAFTVNPPVVFSCDPSSGYEGTWFYVHGKNFIPADTHVYVGDVAITYMYFADKNTIYTYLPYSIPGGPNAIRVESLGQQSNTDVTFRNNRPSATEFSPNQGTYGDIITIKGSGFSPVPEYNSVLFDSFYGATVISATETELRAKVPNYLPNAESQVSVYSNGYAITLPQTFKLMPPEAYSFSPTEAAYGALVEIYGANFCPTAYVNEVYFNDTSASIIEASTTRLVVQVPVYSGEARIRVLTAGNSVYAPGTFKVIP